MEIHEEASTSLKITLLIFALLLMGTLAYFVYRELYTTEWAADISATADNKAEL